MRTPRAAFCAVWIDRATASVAENQPDPEIPREFRAVIPVQIDLPSYTAPNCTHSGLFFEGNGL
jgi:hypothetical protein